jgi:hypothetical protein
MCIKDELSSFLSMCIGDSISTMKSISSDQLLAECLRQLRFPLEFFPPGDLQRLEAKVEVERAALEAEFHAKLRARVAKVITRKSIASVIRDTPDASMTTATPAASNGAAQ